MITNAQRDTIQADAYRKIVTAYDSARSWDEVGISVDTIILDTTKRFQQEANKWEDALMRLDGTRWCRLPNVQFVYWPDRQPPRVLKANGQYEYVRVADCIHFTPPSSTDLYEAMAELEHKHFHTDDQLIVWWRGPKVWNVLQHEDGGPSFCITFGLSHIYEDDVHSESRPEKVDRLTGGVLEEKFKERRQGYYRAVDEHYKESQRKAALQANQWTDFKEER
jgi:hypothetical protein